MEKYLIYVTDGTQISNPIFCDSKSELKNKIQELYERTNGLFFKIEKYIDYQSAIDLTSKLTSNY